MRFAGQVTRVLGAGAGAACCGGAEAAGFWAVANGARTRIEMLRTAARLRSWARGSMVGAAPRAIRRIARQDSRRLNLYSGYYSCQQVLLSAAPSRERAGRGLKSGSVRGAGGGHALRVPQVTRGGAR